jgi:hypothetical protein
VFTIEDIREHTSHELRTFKASIEEVSKKIEKELVEMKTDITDFKKPFENSLSMIQKENEALQRELERNQVLF